MRTKKTISKKTASKKATTQKTAAKRNVASKTTSKTASKRSASTEVPAAEELLLTSMNTKLTPNPEPIKMGELEKRLIEFNVKSKVNTKKILTTINKINPEAFVPIEKMPGDIKKSIPSLRPATKRFHGTKISLAWFPFHTVKSPCADKFGYMSPPAVRNASKLPFTMDN